MVIGMWFTLQSDIEEAKELPKPEVGRTEYDLKDQMIRNTIIETQKDVTEVKEQQKEMREDVSLCPQRPLGKPTPQRYHCTKRLGLRPVWPHRAMEWGQDYRR